MGVHLDTYHMNIEEAGMSAPVLETADELTARRTMFRWLTRYNTKRRHSWCRYQSPNTYERAYTDKLALAA